MVAKYRRGAGIPGGIRYMLRSLPNYCDLRVKRVRPRKEAGVAQRDWCKEAYGQRSVHRNTLLTVS